MLSGHWNSASRVIADATASDIFYSFRGYRSIPTGRRQLSIVPPGPPVRVATVPERGEEGDRGEGREGRIKSATS